VLAQRLLHEHWNLARQRPLDYGQASSFVETIDDDELAGPSRRLLAATRFTGLVEVEFKRSAAGALLLSGCVVAITAYAAGVQMPQFAASPPPAKPTTAQAQQYCQSYLNHFAKDLNTSTTKVQDAAKLAFDQTVDDAVNSKQITKSEGDALKAKFAANQLCSGELSAIGRGAGAAAGRASARRPSRPRPRSWAPPPATS